MTQNGLKIRFLKFYKNSVDGTFPVFFVKSHMQQKVEYSPMSFWEKSYIGILGQKRVQSELLSVIVN